MTDYERKFNDVLGKRTAEACKKRAMDAWYFSTKEEAVEKILELINEGDTVSWGGSETLKEIGIKEKLREGNYNLLDRDTVNTVEEKKEIARKAFFADYFLTSANAMTADGVLINIDGTGNRVAATIFGPENVIFVCGINKIEADKEKAIARAKNKAAAINAQRFSVSTPCAVTGVCGNCLSDECICCQIVETRKSRIKGRIKVIIVGESLGF